MTRMGAVVSRFQYDTLRDLHIELRHQHEVLKRRYNELEAKNRALAELDQKQAAFIQQALSADWEPIRQAQPQTYQKLMQAWKELGA